MGLAGRPWPATVAGGNRRSCTLACLFRRGGPGGAVLDVGGRIRVLTSRFEGPRPWRKPRVVRAGTRNDWGPSPCPPVGPGRNQQEPRMDARSPRENRESGAVLEETAPSRETQAS